MYYAFCFSWPFLIRGVNNCSATILSSLEGKLFDMIIQYSSRLSLIIHVFFYICRGCHKTFLPTFCKDPRIPDFYPSRKNLIYGPIRPWIKPRTIRSSSCFSCVFNRLTSISTPRLRLRSREHWKEGPVCQANHRLCQDYKYNSFLDCMVAE